MPLPDKHIIQQVLENYPESRDDELRLYELYMAAKGFTPAATPIKVIHHKIKLGYLCNYDSVSRMRRMIQKDHIELRGSNYGKRKEMEKKVKKQFAELKPLDIAGINRRLDERARRSDAKFEAPTCPGL